MTREELEQFIERRNELAEELTATAAVHDTTKLDAEIRAVDTRLGSI